MSTAGQLKLYFAIAYAVSWTLWLPLVASVQGWWAVDVPAWWHYAGAAGPITAAITVALLSSGRRGVRTLFSQYAPARAPRTWLAFAVLCPLGLLAIGMLAARLADGSWPTYTELATADNLPALALPVTLLIHTFTFGVGEETGWRGFALPRLQKNRTAISATHVLAALWACWHLPAFFEDESMMSMGPLQITGWCAGLWMGAIFLTWLYNSSKGSLLVVVIWHGLFNQFSASQASSLVPAVMTMGVIVIAIAALRLAGPEALRGLSRASNGVQEVDPAAYQGVSSPSRGRRG